MSEAKTSNSLNQIVPGSKVKVKDSSLVFDVGEVCSNKAHLYLNNKEVAIMLIAELQVL